MYIEVFIDGGSVVFKKSNNGPRTKLDDLYVAFSKQCFQPLASKHSFVFMFHQSSFPVAAYLTLTENFQRLWTTWSFVIFHQGKIKFAFI